MVARSRSACASAPIPAITCWKAPRPASASPILPTFLASDALLAGELVPILLPCSPSGGHISVVYRKTIRTPQKILALSSFLEEEIGHSAPGTGPWRSEGYFTAPGRSGKQNPRFPFP